MSPLNFSKLLSGSAQGHPTAPRKIWTVGTLTYTSGGLAVLFLWLLWGDYAWDMKERATGPVGQLMLRRFGSADWLVGLLTGSLPTAISMFVVPIVSTRSDRHRGKLGRRIPYLLLFTPIISLAMVGVAATPAGGLWLHQRLGSDSPGLMVCQLLVFSFCWTIFEIAVAAVKNLFTALINDVVPGEVMGRFCALFRIIGLSTGIIFNLFLMGKAETHSFQIFVGLALLYFVGFLLMCLNVKEGDYPAPEKPAESRSPTNPVRTYLKECFSQPFYLWFFLATTLGILALGPVNTFSIFHARSVGLSDAMYGKCLAASYFVSLLASYPIGVLADRYHPVRIAIVTMSLYALVTLLGFCFATTQWTFFGAFFAHTVLAGSYLTGVASIRQRLLPAARFGQFASAAEVVIGLCSMVLAPALGLFIGAMDRDYRGVFALGSFIGVLSVIAYFFLLLRFQKLGGDTAYVAP